MTSKETDEAKLRQRLSYWLKNNWVYIDEYIIKPKIIHDYPNVLEEHEEMSRKILEVTGELGNKKIVDGINNLNSN